MLHEQSVFERSFLDTVQSWFAIRNDILVVALLSRTAGARGHFWFKDFALFVECLKRFPPQTDVIVFRDNQFPLRGIVDDELIRQALELIPDNTEAMVTDKLEPPNDSIYIWPCDTHLELAETLHDLIGTPAAIGLYAPWYQSDNDHLISALVPLADGTLKRGVY